MHSLIIFGGVAFIVLLTYAAIVLVEKHQAKKKHWFIKNFRFGFPGISHDTWFFEIESPNGDLVCRNLTHYDDGPATRYEVHEKSQRRAIRAAKGVVKERIRYEKMQQRWRAELDRAKKREEKRVTTPPKNIRV